MNRLLLAIAAFLMCIGCQMDKRFSRLQNGMTKPQVLGIVGKRPDADKTSDGIETVHWDAGNHYAKFKNGRLIEYGSD